MMKEAYQHFLKETLKDRHRLPSDRIIRMEHEKKRGIYDAIWEAYVEGHDSNWLETAKSYAAQQGIDVSGMTDEEILETYGGMGQLLLHVTTTAIIEVA